MADLTFYISEDKSTLIEVVRGSHTEFYVGGAAMKPLRANTTDAAQEKHVPVVTIDGATVTVTVGGVEHPMLPEHYIQTIWLQTSNGVLRKDLAPGEKPEAVFHVGEDKPVVAYEYCNLHGLWKYEIS